MSESKWLFIGTDKRLKVCSELMEDAGYQCRTIETDAFSAELEQALIDFEPNHIVLPILEMAGAIPVNLLAKDTKLYTGVVSEAWLKPFLDAGLTINSYLQEEIFIWENARLTAEAFINIFYSQMGRTILNKDFKVAGFGRIGKVVADMLRALGGKVTIIARSEAQLGEAAARGFQTKRLSDTVDLSASYFVNTIPARWLPIQKERPLFIFDLASAPGCLIDARVPEYYTILPGLPGKHFPLDAAIALKGALERIYRR